MRVSLTTGKTIGKVFTVRKGKEKRQIHMFTINLSFVVIVAVFSAGMLIMNGVLQKSITRLSGRRKCSLPATPQPMRCKASRTH